MEKRRKVGIVLENCDRWLLVITVYWLEFVTALYTALGWDNWSSYWWAGLKGSGMPKEGWAVVLPVLCSECLFKWLLFHDGLPSDWKIVFYKG